MSDKSRGEDQVEELRTRQQAPRVFLSYSMMWPRERKSSADASECMVEFEHALTDRGVVEKTRELLNPLFVLFDFFEPDESIYEDVVGNFIQGRCT